MNPFDINDKRGIDTQYERDIFEYSPNISKEDFNIPSNEHEYEEFGEYKRSVQEVAAIAKTSVVNKTVTNLIDLLNFLSIDIDENMFPYTGEAIRIAKQFWIDIYEHINSDPLTDDELSSIDHLEREIKDDEGKIDNMKSDIDHSVFYEEDPSEGVVKDILDMQNSLDNKKVDLEAKKMTVASKADLNHAVYIYAVDATNTVMQIPASKNEGKILSQNIGTIKKCNPEGVKTIANIVIDDMGSDLEKLDRINKMYFERGEIKTVLRNLSDLMKQRAKTTPAMKQIFQYNMEETVDIINSMIDTIYRKGIQLDHKYEENLKLSMKMMDSQTKIFAKTFADEIRINRFKRLLE